MRTRARVNMRTRARVLVAVCALTAMHAAAAADDVTSSQLPAPTLPPPQLASPPSTSAPAGAAVVRVPYAPEALEPVPPTQRSVVVDHDAAAQLSAATEDTGPTIRLFVQGRGDAPAMRPRTYEQRFADALNGPREVSSIRFSQQLLDTTPCPSIASAGSAFTPAYRSYGFCP